MEARCIGPNTLILVADGRWRALQVGVLAERTEGEGRVALTPEGAKALKGKGMNVLIEMGAGDRAGFSDAAYQDAGAEIAPNGGAVISRAEVILKVLGPADGGPTSEAARLREGSAIISFLFPASNLQTV